MVWWWYKGRTDRRAFVRPQIKFIYCFKQNVRVLDIYFTNQKQNYLRLEIYFFAWIYFGFIKAEDDTQTLAHLVTLVLFLFLSLLLLWLILTRYIFLGKIKTRKQEILLGLLHWTLFLGIICCQPVWLFLTRIKKKYIFYFFVIIVVVVVKRLWIIMDLKIHFLQNFF